MIDPGRIEQQDAVSDFRLMKDAVREAGELAFGFFHESSDNPSWRKADGTKVSEADMAVDRLLHTRLLEARPGYGWLSEETTDDLVRLDKSHVWIVDPIDGTRAFLKGRPHWVVSVALVVNGEVQMGCLYNPAEDEFFEARKDEGARLNDKPITVGGRDRIEGCTVVAAPGRFTNCKWPREWPLLSTFMVNSIAYRLALVACNRADAVLSLSGKSDWDLAAADLIVREAGGVITDHKGEAYVFNKRKTRHMSVLAANPALHDKMLARTKEVEAGKRTGCGHN